MTDDANHITAPHPVGLGAINVMKNTLADAGMKPEDIDYVNVHGTSTPLGDVAETKAILGVFGEVPYAESEGDVNIPYCRISDLVPFCLYDPILNPYVPAEQAKDMTCDFSKF